MRHVETPVLVVGGSLVGLSMSVFLAHHGIEHLVVERHPGTAIHPRAAFLMQRTVELFRGVGLQEEVIAAAEREFEQNGAIVAVESLGGRELQWFFENINEGVEHLTGATPASTTRTTWPGSLLTCSTGGPATTCSTRTRRNGCRSRG